MQLIKLMFTIGSIFVHCLYASSHSSSRTLTPDESATKRSQPTTNFQAVVADLNRRKDQSVQVHLAEVVTRTGGHHGNLTALQHELLRFQELFQGHQQIVGDPNWDPGIDIIVEAVNTHPDKVIAADTAKKLKAVANGLTANKRLIQENEATIQEINDREAIDGKLDEEDRKVRDAAKAKIAEWKKANETLETCLLQFKGVIIQSKRTLVKNATQEAVTLQSCINDLLREAQGSFQKDLARLVTLLRNIGATQNIVDTWEEQTLEKYAYETKDTSIYTMETPFMELRDHWSDFPGRLKQTVQDYRAEGQIVRDKYRTEIATLVSDVNKLMDQISESDTEDASSVMGQLTTLQTSLTVLLTRL